MQNKKNKDSNHPRMDFLFCFYKMANLRGTLIYTLVVFVKTDVALVTRPRNTYSPHGPKMCQLRCNSEHLCFFITRGLCCIRVDIHPSVPRKGNEKTDQPSAQCIIKNDAPDSNPFSNATVSLHEACSTGDLCTVQYLVSLGLANINDWLDGSTPVMAAVKANQEKVFSFLANQGCDLSVITNRTDNLLHLAAVSGGLGIVRKLIDSFHFKIDSKGFRLWTPLMRAAKEGHVKLFHWLMSRGANVYAVGKNGYNILIASANGGNLELVKWVLLRNLSDLESKSSLGNTAAMLAASRGHVDVLDYLLNQGSDRMLENNNHFNMLHLAAIGGKVKTIAYLLDHGFDIDCRTSNLKDTPLLLSATHGHVEAFEYLRGKGSNISAVDKHGRNILHSACNNYQLAMVKHIVENELVAIDSVSEHSTPMLMAASRCAIDIVDFLRLHGCNMTAVDQHGNTVLHKVVRSCSAKAISYVFSLGVINPESKNHQGYTPVLYAVSNNNVKSLEYLSRQNCSLTVTAEWEFNILNVACWYGHLPMVKYIVTKGLADMNTVSSKGYSALLTAAVAGSIKIFDFLILNGANSSDTDNHGRTVLHLSVKSCRVKMVKYILLSYPFLIDTRDDYGQTPLLFAAERGRMEILKILIENGCDVTVVDKHGDNLMHSACISGQRETVAYVAYLKGVDIFRKNKIGLTPLAYAEKKGHVAIVRLLKTLMRRKV